MIRRPVRAAGNNVGSTIRDSDLRQVWEEFFTQESFDSRCSLFDR